MAPTASIEILDLRHFAAPLIRPVIEAEGELWRQRLHWDYRTSAKLLMQYLDSHSLPGYAALEAEKVVGYAFCV
ncbi:MAG TPA: GNAT family N-acetyltransferase, partial [Terracidiphilus sp.]